MTERRDIPCGIYRTTVAIGDSVPVGALVYYHNHGDPGPGVYLPREWRMNRAVFHQRGTTIPDAGYAHSLEPLLPEGLYRVVEPFDCCAERCQHFEEDLLVQLGYNGKAEPLLFIPEMIEGALGFPATGTRIDQARLIKLQPLRVKMGAAPQGQHN